MNPKCDFCSDIRIIEPAKDIFLKTQNKERLEWLKDKQDKKKMIMFVDGALLEVNYCPICGYKFTEEDYDNR